MDGMELICFQIIASSGGAKTCYIEAVREAKQGNFDAAKQLMDQGESFMNQGHQPHSTLIQQEACGNQTPVSLLLIHAEDQMMGAEQFKVLATEMIDLYKRLAGK